MRSRRRVRTFSGQRNSVKDHLCVIEDQGKKYGNFQPSEQPNIDSLNIFPASNRCKTSECHQTDDSVDLDACARRPVLVDDSINDENKTIEKIDKRRNE